MAIASPMISADSIEAGEVGTRLIRIVTGLPGQMYNVFNFTTNKYDGVIDLPSYVGELIAYKDESAAEKTAVLYVAIQNGEILKWVRCNASPSYFNLNTGKPFDPLASFYDPLAS